MAFQNSVHRNTGSHAFTPDATLPKSTYGICSRVESFLRSGRSQHGRQASSYQRTVRQCVSRRRSRHYHGSVLQLCFSGTAAQPDQDLHQTIIASPLISLKWIFTDGCSHLNLFRLTFVVFVCWNIDGICGACIVPVACTVGFVKECVKVSKELTLTVRSGNLQKSR